MAKAQWHNRFVKADQPFKPRIIGRSFGEAGTGKTDFWLGAPGPIAFFSFDKGLEGVVEKFQENKDIYVAEYEWSPTENLPQSEAIALRDQVIEDFETAIMNARTVIIDKETDMWELFRYAEFGAPNDAPRNYPQLNQRYRRLINMPKATDINFGCIQGMKSVWGQKTNRISGKQTPFDTGEREAAGFSELEGLVHVNLFHTREDGTFKIQVGKARGPGSFVVQDQTFDIDLHEDGQAEGFREFAKLLFPESTDEDWS